MDRSLGLSLQSKTPQHSCNDISSLQVKAMETKKKFFTKPERIIARLLNENRIPFKTKIKIGKYETDFLIGKLAIELDGHIQSVEKNQYLANLGYIPWHFTNKEVYENRENIIQRINDNKIQSSPSG